MRTSARGAVHRQSVLERFSPRSTATHGSDGRRVKMPRLRVFLQGPGSPAVFSQRLLSVRQEHHRPDPGGRDPGPEQSGELRLRLPGHGQDEPVQRDGQRIRLLHAVPD